LLQGLPAFLDVVAVLVNPSLAFVREIYASLPIQYMQFHGQETPDFCEQCDVPYLKAISATSTDVITEAATAYTHASALLLDTPSAKGFGGTGDTFDWQVIPSRCAKPLILAGGLDVSNVGRAITHSGIYAVDVCSGIESSPGMKDHQKMTQFVNTIWGKK